VGRVVAFVSAATDLVPGVTDGNSTSDVFVHSFVTATTAAASINLSGTVTGNAFSSEPAISADEHFVAFSSDSSDLVVDDLNRGRDVFRYGPQLLPPCGNASLDVGEECDDGNNLSGDACPSALADNCRYSASGLLIRGNRLSPGDGRRSSCQVEWYVTNPINPPHPFGLPNAKQT